MTKGSTASLKDTASLTSGGPPPAGHCVTTASLEGCALASPVLERFPDQPRRKRVPSSKQTKHAGAQSSLRGGRGCQGTGLSESGWNLLRVSTRWRPGQNQEPGPWG